MSSLEGKQSSCGVLAAGKPRAGGGITLKLLIDEGILQPGDNILSVEYKSSMTYASLEHDGRISCFVSHNDRPLLVLSFQLCHQGL